MSWKRTLHQDRAAELQVTYSQGGERSFKARCLLSPATRAAIYNNRIRAAEPIFSGYWIRGTDQGAAKDAVAFMTNVKKTLPHFLAPGVSILVLFKYADPASRRFRGPLEQQIRFLHGRLRDANDVQGRDPR